MSCFGSLFHHRPVPWYHVKRAHVMPVTIPISPKARPTRAASAERRSRTRSPVRRYRKACHALTPIAAMSVNHIGTWKNRLRARLPEDVVHARERRQQARQHHARQPYGDGVADETVAAEVHHGREAHGRMRPYRRGFEGCNRFRTFSQTEAGRLCTERTLVALPGSLYDGGPCGDAPRRRRPRTEASPLCRTPARAGFAAPHRPSLLSGALQNERSISAFGSSEGVRAIQ